MIKNVFKSNKDINKVISQFEINAIRILIICIIVFSAVYYFIQVGEEKYGLFGLVIFGCSLLPFLISFYLKVNKYFEDRKTTFFITKDNRFFMVYCSISDIIIKFNKKDITLDYYNNTFLYFGYIFLIYMLFGNLNYFFKDIDNSQLEVLLENKVIPNFTGYEIKKIRSINKDFDVYNIEYDYIILSNNLLRENKELVLTDNYNDFNILEDKFREFMNNK